MQFAVIGIGRFGSSVARSLYKLGYEVLIIDNDEARIQEMVDCATHAVQVDSTDEQTLKAVGIRNFDVAIVAIGENIQASILTTIVLKDLGVKRVIVKARNDLHAKVLEKLGADRVVHPERDMGERLVHQIISPNILDYIELEEDYSIGEIIATEWMVGKTMRQLDIRAKFGCNVMAIKSGHNVNVSPRAEDVIQSGDLLIVIGHNDDLRRLDRNE